MTQPKPDQFDARARVIRKIDADLRNSKNYNEDELWQHIASELRATYQRGREDAISAIRDILDVPSRSDMER